MKYIGVDPASLARDGTAIAIISMVDSKLYIEQVHWRDYYIPFTWYDKVMSLNPCNKLGDLYG